MTELGTWGAGSVGETQGGIELFRALIDLSPDAIAIHVGGKVVFANPAGLRLFRAPGPEAVIGRSVLEFVHPVDRDGVRARVASMHATGEPVPAQEERFITLDGSEFVGDVSATPFHYGGEAAVLVVIRDVTARRQAEEERQRQLAEAEAARTTAERAQRQLSLVAGASRVLAGSLDYATTLASVAHLAVPELADWCVVDVIRPDGSIERVVSAHTDPEKEAWAREFERRYPSEGEGVTGIVARTGQPLLASEITEEMLTRSARDPEYLAGLLALGIRSSLTVPLQARGQTLGSITLIAAESGRRYSENDIELAQELATRAALAVDNARLYQESQRVAAERAAILNQMVEGVAIVDSHGTIVFVNEAAERIAGRAEPGAALEAMAVPYRTLTLDGSLLRGDQLPLARALRGETRVNDVWRMRRADGVDIVVQGSAAPVHDEHGERLGAVAIFRDVTAQVELEQQKNEFLSLIAHEIRTPVTVIQAFAQLLGQELREHEGTMRRRFEAVTRQTRQLTALVDDLLDLTRLETGHFAIVPAEIDYFDLIELVVEEFSLLYPDRTVVPAMPVRIRLRGDAGRLRQVLVNLLQNAATYGPEDAEITVTVELKDGQALTTVWDGGPPIPAGERERIFERFYRMAAHRRSRPQGLGIGLFLSRAVVEAHGGRIWIPDVPESCIAFSLPLPY